MFKSLRTHIILAAMAAIVTIPLTVEPVEAQAGDRMRVVVPHMAPTDDTRARFGERVADRVRDRLDLDRHVAISQRDTDRAARDFDMRFNDLDCLFARQLAPQIGADIVMCGEYHAEGDQIRVETTFWTVPQGESLSLEPFLIAENQETQAAEQIVEGFQILADQIALLGWCADEARSSNWTQAQDYCSRALAAVPDARAPRFNLGRAELELGNYAESLELFQVILEEDPGDDDALEYAGYSAAQIGESDLAREYYTRFLEINPDNVNVRVRVAHDLATAGDPRGAMDLLEEGLEQEPDHVGLLEQYGSNAFRAARQLQDMRPAAQDGDATLDPEVAELFREAARALIRVVELEGDEANPTFVVNAVRAHLQLSEYDEALRIAQIGTETFPGNAAVWSEQATAANRAGNTALSVSSLEAALEINPELPNARTRMGTYYLEAGQVDDAISALRAAADAGEREPDALARIVLGRAWNNHLNPEQDIPEGIRLMEQAKQFNVSSELKEELNFFHGYGLFKRGEQVEAPETVESARQALPIFRAAKEQLQAARGHGERNPSLNLNQFLENADIFIERQERIIERGGNRR